MIILHFENRDLKESEKKRYAKIIARAIPMLIQNKKFLFPVNKDFEIEIKLIFK